MTAIHATYTDPALEFRTGEPFTRRDPNLPDSHFVQQEHPVPDSMRPLAAPITLPATVTVTYYTARPVADGETPADPRPAHYHADLDPAANHGYTRVSFSQYHDAGRGFTLTATTGPGDIYPAGLHPCPRCGDPWCRTTQEAYGNATDCPACGYHHFYDIGD